MVPEAGSWFLSAWGLAIRFGLGAFLLLPWVFQFGVRANEWKQGGVLAFWCGFGMWFQSDALAHTAASTSAFLTQGYCLFLPLWFAVQSRKWPSTHVLLATVMVISGVTWLSGVGPENLRLGRGETETLLAALFFTFQILTLENPHYSGNRGLPVAFVMFAAIGLVLLPMVWWTAPAPAAILRVGASADVLWLLLALTVFSTVGAYLLMIFFQRGVSATEAGLIYCAEPVFTAGYVLFLPSIIGAWTGNTYANETWTPALIGGGLLITLANAIMQTGGGKNKPAPGTAVHPPV